MIDSYFFGFIDVLKIGPCLGVELEPFTDGAIITGDRYILVPSVFRI
jgi:hypothetical protein